MIAVRRAVEEFLAVSVASSFLISGFHHFENPYGFLHSVYSYHVLGASSGIGFAAIVPSLSLVVGVSVLMPEIRAASSCIACLLLSSFLIAQIYVVYLDEVIDCGCFGRGSSPVDLNSLVRVSLLLVASIGLVVATRSKDREPKF